jgi:hypothetical protein
MQDLQGHQHLICRGIRGRDNCNPVMMRLAGASERFAMTDPAIAVLPYEQSLGPRASGLALSALNWPLGQPADLIGGVLGDLRRHDHLIAYPRTNMHFQLRRGTKARISLIMGEPRIIHARHINLLHYTHRRFHRVLTFNEELLRAIPNGIFFPLGTTWVPDWRDLDLRKTRMASLIASQKRISEGHKLRHAVVERVQKAGDDVDIMGQGYRPFEIKSDGLAPYRYSVVIENVREPNYFSEKLVDAVLCDTVPIYWGCPNLERFMDPSGIIQCQNLGDIQAALAGMSDADWQARLPALQALKPVLESHCGLEERAAQAVRNSL